jgi:hypothetical protein
MPPSDQAIFRTSVAFEPEGYLNLLTSEHPTGHLIRAADTNQHMSRLSRLSLPSMTQADTKFERLLT